MRTSIACSTYNLVGTCLTWGLLRHDILKASGADCSDRAECQRIGGYQIPDLPNRRIGDPRSFHPMTLHFVLEARWQIHCIQCIKCTQCIQCIQCLQCFYSSYSQSGQCIQRIHCNQCFQCIQCVEFSQDKMYSMYLMLSLYSRCSMYSDLHSYW